LQQERLDELTTQMKIDQENEGDISIMTTWDGRRGMSDNESGSDWWYDSEEGDYD